MIHSVRVAIGEGQSVPGDEEPADGQSSTAA
jgi:hypothetical protein